MRWDDQTLNLWCCWKSLTKLSHLITFFPSFILRKSVRLSARFAVSLSVLPPSIPPLQGQYPGRESGPACWCHLLHRRRLRLTLLLCHRVLLRFWILLRVCSVQIQLRRRDGHHLLWKMNPPVLLNSPLKQRRMNGMKTGMKTGKMNRKGQRKK